MGKRAGIESQKSFSGRHSRKTLNSTARIQRRWRKSNGKGEKDSGRTRLAACGVAAEMCFDSQQKGGSGNQGADQCRYDNISHPL